ncbi:recombinase family protein [Undibacterium sp. Xuan67W]|uniref:recombinase family protein n=1 Tax=Undibacterium sp. Xuan67W TaxID=3413057 RepID=UPI003BF00184
METKAICDGAKYTPEVLREILAFSYIRFSTKRQGGGDSQRRQLERSRHYAAEHGLKLVEKSYEDLGVSAFDRSNVTKGQLAAFIEAVETGKIPRGSYLLVENLDRLSRSHADEAVALLSSIVRLGIKVVTLCDGSVFDQEAIRNPMNLIMAVLAFVHANEESITKSDRVKEAHEQKRKMKCSFAFGQGPGWLRPNVERTGWEVVPEKATSVRRVFELTARGFGATAIARIANREKWPVPGRANTWHKTLPNKLIHNRRVLGELEPQVKEANGRRPTGEIWEGYYPAIISLEVFDAASASAERRRNLPKRRDSGYRNVFQGILHCGHCGATLARKSKNGKRNSEGYALYVCSDRDRGLSKCPNWNARRLEDLLLPPLIECVASEVVAGTAKQRASEEMELVRVAESRSQKSLGNLVRNIELTGGSQAIAERIRALESERHSLRRTLQELAIIVNDPVTHVWTEDVDVYVFEALKAVRDSTDAFVVERELLHQTLIRVLRNVRVWPENHAVAEFRNEDISITLPLVEAPKEVPGCDSFFIF